MRQAYATGRINQVGLLLPGGAAQGGAPAARGARQRACAARPGRSPARHGGGPCGVCWTVGFGSLLRSRVEGVLPKRTGLGPVSSESGRSPECATRWKGSRKRVSGRAFGGGRFVGAESREGRPTAAAAWGGPWEDHCGQTGRLGLARPGSAAEGPEETAVSPCIVLRAWSGPQAASSVRRA